MINAVQASVDGWIRVLLVFSLITGALMATRKDLLSLVSAYRMQSLVLSMIALSLYVVEGSDVLLYLSLLTIASKVLLIPYAIRRIMREINIQRDVGFNYLSPSASLLASIMLVLLAYTSFSKILKGSSPDSLLYLGAVFGISLALMGMMTTFSRRKVVTKIIGYLSMENGVLLFSLFVTELPFIIEVLVLVDLFMIVVLATLLSIGIDSSIEEFREKFNSIHMRKVPSRLLRLHKKHGRDG